MRAMSERALAPSQSFFPVSLDLFVYLRIYYVGTESTSTRVGLPN